MAKYLKAHQLDTLYKNKKGKFVRKFKAPQENNHNEKPHFNKPLKILFEKDEDFLEDSDTDEDAEFSKEVFEEL